MEDDSSNKVLDLDLLALKWNMPRSRLLKAARKGGIGLVSGRRKATPQNGLRTGHDDAKTARCWYMKSSDQDKLWSILEELENKKGSGIPYSKVSQAGLNALLKASQHGTSRPKLAGIKPASLREDWLRYIEGIKPEEVSLTWETRNLESFKTLLLEIIDLWQLTEERSKVLIERWNLH